MTTAALDVARAINTLLDPAAAAVSSLAVLSGETRFIVSIVHQSPALTAVVVGAATGERPKKASTVASGLARLSTLAVRHGGRFAKLERDVRRRLGRAAVSAARQRPDSTLVGNGVTMSHSLTALAVQRLLGENVVSASASKETGALVKSVHDDPEMRAAVLLVAADGRALTAKGPLAKKLSKLAQKGLSKLMKLGQKAGGKAKDLAQNVARKAFKIADKVPGLNPYAAFGCRHGSAECLRDKGFGYLLKDKSKAGRARKTGGGKRCEVGTARNRKTGKCDPKLSKAKGKKPAAKPDKHYPGVGPKTPPGKLEDQPFIKKPKKGKKAKAKASAERAMVIQALLSAAEVLESMDSWKADPEYLKWDAQLRLDTAA